MTALGRLERVMSHTIHKSRRSLSLIIAVLAAFAIALVASPAWAHDELVGSDPAAGSQIDELPAEITLTFSAVLMNETGATEVVVTDATGADLTAGDPTLDGTRVIQPVSGDVAGVVTVIWRVVSSDGHPISDTFSFTVGNGGVAPGTPSDTATFAPGPDMQDNGMGIVWIALGIVAVGLGGALVAVLVAKARSPRED